MGAAMDTMTTTYVFPRDIDDEKKRKIIEASWTRKIVLKECYGSTKRATMGQEKLQRAADFVQCNLRGSQNVLEIMCGNCIASAGCACQCICINTANCIRITIPYIW